MGVWRWIAAWLGSGAALVLAKWPTLHDPHYWDALGGYVPQSRAFATLSAAGIAERPFVRPPLFTFWLAGAMRMFGDHVVVVHVACCLFNAIALPAAYAITRALGGGRAAGALAALLVAVSPAYFAQSAQALTDMPVAALIALAWLCVLRKRMVGFVVFASLAMLTKETAYYISVPAAGLIWVRSASLREWVRRAWPLGVPWLVLGGWLLVHKRITGVLMVPDHSDALALRHFGYAMLHNFVDGGRALLVLAAVLPVARALGRGELPFKHEIRWTAAAVVLLPILFCTTLARYMLPSLVPLCALAALGVMSLGARLRWPLAVALPALLLVGVNGLYFQRDLAHLEVSMAHRQNLALHKQAAETVAALHPRGVLATFPLVTVFRAPAADGYLPEPLNGVVAFPWVPLDELCKNDLLVHGQDNSILPALERLRAASALTFVTQLGPLTPRGDRDPPEPLDPNQDRAIRIYRVSCPSGQATR